MKHPQPIPRCFVAGCEKEGGVGFEWGGRKRDTCLSHRPEGQAWLDRAKSAGATCTAPEEPGRLL